MARGIADALAYAKACWGRDEEISALETRLRAGLVDKRNSKMLNIGLVILGIPLMELDPQSRRDLGEVKNLIAQEKRAHGVDLPWAKARMPTWWDETMWGDMDAARAASRPATEKEQLANAVAYVLASNQGAGGNGKHGAGVNTYAMNRELNAAGVQWHADAAASGWLSPLAQAVQRILG